MFYKHIFFRKMLLIYSDDFSPIFIGNLIFLIKETENSNGVPILCQAAFSSLSLSVFCPVEIVLTV